MMTDSSRPTLGDSKTYLVWHISVDLMMASAIRVESQRSGWTFQPFNAQRFELLTEIPSNVRALFVDLQTPGLNRDHLKRLVNATNSPSLQVTLYAQHLSEMELTHGRELAIGPVMTRGQFNQALGRLLSSLPSKNT